MVRKAQSKSAPSPRRSWIARRFRLLIGAVSGVAAGVVAHLAGASAEGAVLAGWNLGALAYLVLTWRLILTADEMEVRHRAAEEDESRFGVLVIVIGAMAASLAAIVIMLVRAKNAHGLERAVAPAVAALTLVVSWLTMQTVFVLHYAHRHFAGRVGAFKFPGEPASTYRDFAYLSLCIGATFQVSDPEVTRSSLRNLVAVHSVIAYFYNTAILALGINIVAGLIGR